jgi:endonuclease/exonuclease/phosphatase (EEP) superfamily protein YafD
VHPVAALTLRALRAAVFGLGCLAAAVLVLRWVGWEAGPLVPLVTFTPYAVVPALVAAVGLALLRAPRRAAVCALVCAGLVATQLPLYVAADDRPAGPYAWDLTVMTSNLYGGATNSERFVELVRDNDVDLLMVQEFSTWQAQQLTRAGLGELLPHAAQDPHDAGAGGTGIFSRYPLTEGRLWRGQGGGHLVAELGVPGSAEPLTVVSVHPYTVRPRGNAIWSTAQRDLAAWLEPLEGAVIVAGDFNATYDHAAFRRYLDAGYVDAAEATGAGVVRTWPARHPLFPAPFAAIDHVLTRGGPVPVEVRSMRVRNSDHLGLVARVVMER